MINFLFKKLFRSKNYISLGYNWADSFKDYVKEHLIIKEIEKMHFIDKKNRIKAVELLSKNIFITPRIHENILVEKKTLFSTFDIKVQNFILRKKIWKHYAFPFSSFYANVYFYHNGLRLFKQTILQNYIQNKTAIDIGAYNGDSAYIFSLYNFSKIFCFELDKKNINDLRINKERFSMEKVEIFNIAISSHEHVINYNSSSTSSLIRQDGTHQANATSLDAFLEKHEKKKGGGGLD